MHGNSYKIIMVFPVVLLGQMCLELKYVRVFFLENNDGKPWYIPGPSMRFGGAHHPENSEISTVSIILGKVSPIIPKPELFGHFGDSLILKPPCGLGVTFGAVLR